MADSPIRRPELAELETFLLAARHGSLTEAAGVLQLSKTAVAKRLRSLEALVGHRLLDRGPRGATLTEHGRRLVPDVEALLRESDRVFERLAELRADGDQQRISGLRSLSGSSAVSTERVLRETEHVFAEIFHSIDDGVIVIDPRDSRTLEVNDECARMLGQTREQMLGKRPSDLGVIARAEEEAILAAAMTTPIDRQVIDLRVGGSVTSVEFSLRSITLGGELRLLAICRDVSVRVARERFIVKQAAQQQAVAELTLSALAGEPAADVFGRTAELVASHLDASLAAVWESHGGVDALRSVQGVAPETLTAVSGTPESRRRFEQAMAEDGEMWSDDLTRDRRFSRRGVRALGMRSLAVVRVGARIGESYGFVAAASTAVAAFAPSDREFIHSVANVLGVMARNDLRAREQQSRQVQLENFVALVDASRDPSALLSLDGHYIFLNHAARGFRASDPSVDPASDSIYGALDARAARRLMDVVFPETQRNGRWDGAFTVRRPSGERRPGRLTTVLVRDPTDGSPRWIAAIFSPNAGTRPAQPR